MTSITIPNSEQYNKIIYESMGGKGHDDFEKNEKIIKNVLKEVVVDNLIFSINIRLL